MKRLAGFDLNGWRDLAVRNWLLRPGDEEELGSHLVSAGIGGTVAMIGEKLEPIGGAQGRLAPHGRGEGWGEIGKTHRRVRVTDLLARPEENVREISAALSALAHNSAVGVLAIPDTGRVSERDQEALLEAMRRVKSRRSLLVWRPVLATLAVLETDALSHADKVGIISHDAKGFATQTLDLRRGESFAPERRNTGRIHESELGLEGLRAMAVKALAAAIPDSIGIDHLVLCNSADRLALGDQVRREPIRRNNGAWDVIDPPKGLELGAVAPPPGIAEHFGDCDVILLETPTAGHLRQSLTAMWNLVFPGQLQTLDHDAVAQGALVAARRLSEGVPVYFDFLPQISTIVQGRDGARSADLIPEHETLPAGTVYRSRKPVQFALQSGQDRVDVYLRKETEETPRRAAVTLPSPVSRTTPVDLHVEQAPASGRARLTLTSEALHTTQVIDWDAAEPVANEWDEIIASLERPHPTIPNRLVLPSGLEVWQGLGNRTGISEVLAENLGRKTVDWEALADLASARPGGRYAVSSDGELPAGLGRDEQAMLDQMIDRAEREVHARLKRPAAPDNKPLQFATWMFRRCPASLIAPMMDALDAAVGTHPFLRTAPSRTLIYQGLGRTARTEPECRQTFDHLLSLPVERWKKDQTACAGFLLSRTDEAPQVLTRKEVELLARVVARQLERAVGGDYTASFIYAPILLVGLLRWRRVDPWALVAGQDLAADGMLKGLDSVISDLAKQIRRVPRLAKHRDLLVQSRQELNGEGGNSNLLIDLYTLEP